jgi:hypothetical protein
MELSPPDQPASSPERYRDAREAARAALAAGLSVVPPHEDGTKSPMKAPDGRTWGAFQKSLPTEADLQGWYGTAPTSKLSGLGAVTGRVSNLECLEFDRGGLHYEEFKARAHAVGLGELVERIDAGYSERSPTGGVHWLYRCSVISGNTDLAQYYTGKVNEKGKPEIKASIQTRGEGGYVILAPSNGRVHETGGSYVLMRGGFSTITTITPQEREALFELARSFTEVIKDQPINDYEATHKFAKPTHARAQRTYAGDWPDIVLAIDDYNARVHWDDVLPALGWPHVYTDGTGERYWRRPGKQKGISASTGRNEADRFWNWSSSADFPTETPLSKFDVLLMTRFGGDFSAAHRWIIQEGYGQHKRWVKEAGTWVLRTFQNPCPKGERRARLGDEPPADDEQESYLASGGAGGDGPPDDPGSGAAPDSKPRGGKRSDDRIDIHITAEFHECVDAAVEAVVGHPDVYERGNMLVQVVRKETNDQSDAKGVKRVAGTPMIVSLHTPAARTLISRLARFWRFDARSNEWVRKQPPKDVAEAVLALGNYPGSRQLTGIIEAPTLKPDGSILDTPGYNADTGLLYLPSADYPEVPDLPSFEDVQQAKDNLLYLVQDFPFASETDKAGWLALLLTLVARESDQGN